MAYKQKSSGLPFKELGSSPAKQTKFPESEASKEVKGKRQTKRRKTLADPNTSSKDFKRIASIPPIILQIWTKEHNGSRNWFALPKETQNKILRTKLNSSEFRYFRTAEGKL